MTDEEPRKARWRAAQLGAVAVLLGAAVVSPWRFGQNKDYGLDVTTAGRDAGPLVLVGLTVALIVVAEVLVRTGQRRPGVVNEWTWRVRLLALAPGAVAAIAVALSSLDTTETSPGIGPAYLAAAGVLATHDPLRPAPTRLPWRVMTVAFGVAAALATIPRTWWLTAGLFNAPASAATLLPLRLVRIELQVAIAVLMVLVLGFGALRGAAWTSRVALLASVSVGSGVAFAVYSAADGTGSQSTLPGLFAPAAIAAAVLTGGRREPARPATYLTIFGLAGTAVLGASITERGIVWSQSGGDMPMVLAGVQSQGQIAAIFLAWTLCLVLYLATVVLVQRHAWVAAAAAAAGGIVVITGTRFLTRTDDLLYLLGWLMGEASGFLALLIGTLVSLRRRPAPDAETQRPADNSLGGLYASTR